jgi:hypothetical protein
MLFVDVPRRPRRAGRRGADVWGRVDFARIFHYDDFIAASRRPLWKTSGLHSRPRVWPFGAT